MFAGASEQHVWVCGRAEIVDAGQGRVQYGVLPVLTLHSRGHRETDTGLPGESGQRTRAEETQELTSLLQDLTYRLCYLKYVKAVYIIYHV